MRSQELIGKPLVSAFPYSVVINVDTDNGYSHCGHNVSKYAKHAGDPNYNILNECCLAINDGNPPATGFSTLAQASMDYVITEGPGRTDFVRYWRLMAEAVAQVQTHIHTRARAHTHAHTHTHGHHTHVQGSPPALSLKQATFSVSSSLYLQHPAC